MRVVDIIDGTTVDGPGFRTSIYFAGCSHCCTGCHNPYTWDFNTGYDISIDGILERINRNEMNVTFSGGDPLYQIGDLVKLAARVKESGKTVWCYTGFLYEEIVDSNLLSPILNYIDVLVDGPFIQSQRNTDLIFKGSENQRLIDIPQSSPGNIVIWEPDVLLNTGNK